MYPKLANQLRGGRVASALLLGSVALLVICDIYRVSGAQAGLSSLAPKLSMEEIGLGFKIMLGKLKIRQEPLARMNNEVVLSRLLRDKRKLRSEIKSLMADISELNEQNRPSSGATVHADRKPHNRVKFSKLAKKDADEKRKKLEVKLKQLKKLRHSIQETKNIIAHPEKYISVPSNYGTQTPEEVQEEDRELMLEDLKNMYRRQQIREGEIEKPFVLSDNW